MKPVRISQLRHLPALIIRGAAAVLGLLPLTPARADWPQWRGPDRSGAFHGPAWPADFSDLKPAWEIPLGPSYSGPIITDRFVFTTESVDKRLERVHAIDRTTGKTVWMAEWEGYKGVPFFAAKNGDWIC